MNKKSFGIITLIIAFAFIIRFMNLSFPTVTAEEARIAHRGYTLAKYGTDELGRKFPLIFNSLDDYQLPAVSYLTMIGVALFGKTDLGVRIPFILIGTMLVFLAYKIGKSFSTNPNFGIISAFLVATSPTLIFLSKVPNEIIVLVFIFTLLFYQLINNKNLQLVILTMILATFVSVFSWFLMLPFLFYMGLFKSNLRNKRKFILLGASVVIVISAFLLFLTIPQSKRSLLENHFSIFSDITIRNGINTLRGQVIQSGWPGLIEKLLFNKLHYLTVGLLHWFSHFLNPALYFGQFDETGKLNFSYLGAWTKILIIPAAWGLFSIIRSIDRKTKLLMFLPAILTYPATFIYPKFSLELIALALPFIAIIITVGVTRIIQFNKNIAFLGFIFIVLELAFNLYNFSPEYKNTNSIRSGWVQDAAIDIFKSSKNNQTAVSDDIVSDVATFLNWYTPVGDELADLNIDWPYKFRQYSLANIEIIGSEKKFRSCGKNENLSLFLSRRDLSKIQHEFPNKIINSYQDYLKEDQAFFIDGGICLN